ncbi:MAG: sulfite oxidase heme-binding subunit YedZ [Methylobacter sp.]
MILQIDNLRSKTIAACLLPLLWLVIDIIFDNLGANPAQALHIRLGDWSLRFICLTLAITPVQVVTGWRGMADYRQLLGLFAFFYASLHVLAYLLVDHALAWHAIAVDVIESPYVWFGLLSYVIILLLALTSPKWAKRRMGKNWKKLHRFIYLAAIAGVIHYFWQLKGNLAEPLLYSLLLFLLLSFRVLVWLKGRHLGKTVIPASRAVLALVEEQPDLTDTAHKQS